MGDQVVPQGPLRHGFRILDGGGEALRDRLRLQAPFLRVQGYVQNFAHCRLQVRDPVPQRMAAVRYGNRFNGRILRQGHLPGAGRIGIALLHLLEGIVYLFPDLLLFAVSLLIMHRKRVDGIKMRPAPFHQFLGKSVARRLDLFFYCYFLLVFRFHDRYGSVQSVRQIFAADLLRPHVQRQEERKHAHAQQDTDRAASQLLYYRIHFRLLSL